MKPGSTPYLWESESEKQHYYSWQRWAGVHLHRAILDKKLVPARMWLCVDCGDMAQGYDHRDYAQPLLVDPVCKGCNKRRGKAKYPRDRFAPEIECRPKRRGPYKPYKPRKRFKIDLKVMRRGQDASVDPS